MAQNLVPNADIARTAVTDAGGGTTNLYQSIDEVVANDADYVRSPASTTGLLDCSLSSGTDPVSSSGHILRARGNRGSGLPFSSPAIIVKLYQGDPNSGGTLIATLTCTILATITDFSYTLTGAEADAITNYGALYLRIDFNNGNNFVMTNYQTYFEIPDAAAASIPHKIYKTNQAIPRASFY